MVAHGAKTRALPGVPFTTSIPRTLTSPGTIPYARGVVTACCVVSTSMERRIYDSMSGDQVSCSLVGQEGARRHSPEVVPH